MKIYKLTTQKNTTYNKTLWGENVSHETDGSGELCSPGWLHAYTDPLLAVLLNPIHANITNSKLWEAEGSGEQKDDRGLKVGFTRLTTIKEIPLPFVSLTQKAAFAILCALEVYKEPTFVEWAEKWLSWEDRNKAAANAANAAANTAANAAKAAHYAADAADAAYAYYTAYTAYTAYAAYAAAAAANTAANAAANTAANVAANAANAAANAAYYTANAALNAKSIDLKALASKAMNY